MEETNDFQQEKQKSIALLCNLTALNRLHELKIWCNEKYTKSEGLFMNYASGFNDALVDVEEKINEIITELKQE